jgi:hypothetical protein
VLIIAIFGTIVANNSLDHWPHRLWWNKTMARLNDHGKDFRYLILVMTVQISQQVWVKLQKLDLVSSDHSGDQSQHVQFDLVFVIAFLQLGEKFFNETKRIIDGINWQKIGAKVDKLLS